MDKKILTSTIFNNLRILHSVTPQDTYILNYRMHYEREGDEFFDQYSLAFWWGTNFKPKKILEIGSRSGISLVQLLSSYVDFSDMRVVLFDLWNDGLCTPNLIRKHLKHMGIEIEPEFYQGDSRITVPQFMEKNIDKFDYILVDGDHSQEGATWDLESAYQLIAKGGVIVFDDIVSFDGLNLRPVWDNFKNKYLNKFNWFEDTHGKGVGWAVKI